MARTRRRVALLSAATGGQFDRSLRYRESIAPRGFRFDLRAVYSWGREHWAQGSERPDWLRKRNSRLLRTRLRAS